MGDIMKEFRLDSIKKRVLGLSIRKKFMLSYLLIIVFTCTVIGYASISVSSRYLKNKTLDMSSQLTFQVLLNVDSRSAEFENIAYRMVSDSKFQQVARNHLSVRSQIDDYMDASTLGTIISVITIYNPHILNIHVLMQSGTTFSWQKGNPKLNVNSLTAEEQTMAGHLVERVQQESTGMLWERTGNATIQFVKKVVDNENLSGLGYVIYEIEPEHFRLSLPAGSSLVDPANIAVLNKDNNTVVSAENQIVASLVEYVLLQRQQGNELNGKTFRYEKKDYMMFQTNAQYSKWKVLCFIPLIDIWRDVALITYGILFAGMVCLIIAGWLAWFLSGNTTHNINVLQENMQKVEKGDFSVRIRPASQDEIGKLSLQFNYMVEKIDDLIQDVADERMKRQAKEYEVLQTQINPHFLYNTLGSIKCLAQVKYQPEIEKMITCLIEILKATLNKNGKNWRLGEELAYVDYYLDLQKIRYEDHFRVQYDIAEETEDLLISGFILQPLVENAIYHGFELEKPGGVIQIKSRIENGCLMIWVRDNGTGMNEETAQRILGQRTEPYKRLNSIGIKNVDERIKYSFGEGYGLSLSSAEGQGTTVSIRLPVIQGDDI
jgi:sensor histidine kinase YesM